MIEDITSKTINSQEEEEDDDEEATQRPTKVNKLECFRCHRYDHYKLECPINVARSRRKRSHYVEKDEEISLLMACFFQGRS